MNDDGEVTSNEHVELSKTWLVAIVVMGTLAVIAMALYAMNYLK
jgi:hypothetical protein